MPFPAKVKRCTESLQKLPRSGFPFLSVLRFFPDAEQPPEQASQALGAFEKDRKSTRLNSSHANESRMPSSA